MKKKYNIKSDGNIESRVEPKDWFRFEEPYKSPRDGPSYVSGEDVIRILESSYYPIAEKINFYRLRG